MSNIANINTISPVDIYREKKAFEVVKETSLPSFLDIVDEYEDYRDILSGLSFGVTEIGKASSIDYSGFGAVDDGCKRK